MQRIASLLDAIAARETCARLETAVQAALVAGGIIRSLYDQPHQVRMKGEVDLVTEADLASEAAIIAILQERCPEIPVMAEESAGADLGVRPGPLWIIDPLDGTTNFAHSFPWFGVSIALVRDGASEVGVIYCPMLDELFCAVKGAGAWLNGKRITVSDTEFPIQALVATGFPYDIHRHLDDLMAQMERVLPQVRDLRRAGAAALDLAYVACGRLDGFYEMALKPWDTAAGWLLVIEAGGRVSDFEGRPYTPFLPEILATNGLIHDQLRRMLQ